MSVAIKNLGVSAIISATAVTPGPAVGKSWIVKSVMLTNKDSASRSMDLKLVGGNGVPSGNPTVYIAPPSMSLSPAGTTIIDTEITLQNPSGGTAQTLSIAALGTGTIAVDVVINGLERDI